MESGALLWAVAAAGGVGEVATVGAACSEAARVCSCSAASVEIKNSGDTL